MERLYYWILDECILQFFFDVDIFKLVYDDFFDLELLLWMIFVEEFIEWYRFILESEVVFVNFYYWIDLIFGYKFVGKVVVRVKNVYFYFIDKYQFFSNYGVVQLFIEFYFGRV